MGGSEFLEAFRAKASANNREAIFPSGIFSLFCKDLSPSRTSFSKSKVVLMHQMLNAISSDVNPETPEIELRLGRLVASNRLRQVPALKSSNSTNSSMGSRQVRQHCQFSPESNGYHEHAMEDINFFARTHDRILKVARRLADLAGA
jgi:hypothetical protein